MFSKIVNSPWIALAPGAVLAFSSGYQAFTDLEHSHPGSHHGVFVYGLIMALRALPDVYRGLKEVDQGRNEETAQKEEEREKKERRE